MFCFGFILDWNWPTRCSVVIQMSCHCVNLNHFMSLAFVILMYMYACVCFCSCVSCVWIIVTHPDQVCIGATWLMFKLYDLHVLTYATNAMMAAGRITQNSKVQCINEANGCLIKHQSIIHRGSTHSPDRDVPAPPSHELPSCEQNSDSEEAPPKKKSRRD